MARRATIISGRAFQAQAYYRVRADSQFDQVMCHAVGPRVQLPIAHSRWPAHEGDRIRGSPGLFLKKLMDAAIASVVGRSRVPFDQDGPAFALGQQRQFVHRSIGVSRCRLKECPVVPHHALRRAVIEQVGVNSSAAE